MSTGLPLLRSEALDTGQVVVYHASPGLGICGVLIDATWPGLTPLVTPRLHPRHYEAPL